MGERKKRAEYEGASEKAVRWVLHWTEALGCTAPEAYESRIHQMARDFDRELERARYEGAVKGSI